MKSKTLLIFLSLVLVISVMALVIGCAPKTTAPAPTTTAPATAATAKTTAPPTTAVPASKTVLKFAHHFAVTTDMHKYITSWANKVKELSDGKIEVEIYPAEQMGKATDATRIVQSGLADITNIGFEPGRYPILLGLIYSGQFKNLRDDSRVMRAMYEQIDAVKAESAAYGWKFMFNLPTLGYDFYTKKPVQTLEGLKGMLIRGGGGIWDQVVAGTGAKPVSLASAEIYLALQRGTIDGAYYHSGSYVAIKLWEVAPYGLLSGIQRSGGPYVININTYNKLSSYAKAILDAATVWQDEKYADYLLSSEAGNIKQMKERGVQLFDMSAQDMSKMRDILAKVVDNWVTANPKAKEAVDFIRASR